MISEDEILDDNDSTQEAYTNKINRRVATLCIIYLLLSLAFISWQLFDVWIGQHSLARWVRYDLEPLNTPTYRLIFFTVMAGGLGGVVNGIRSILEWFPKFDRRYAWKYITAPWLGTALALLVYTLLNSGVSVFGGGNITDVDTTRVLAMFSTGALAGYGSRDVFIWLDNQVSRLFNPEETPQKDMTEAADELSEESVEIAEDIDEVANAETEILALSGGDMNEMAPMAPEPEHLVDAKGSV